MPGGLGLPRGFDSLRLRFLRRYTGGRGFFDCSGRRPVRAGRLSARGSAASAEDLAEFVGYIVVHRAGVSLLLGDAQFREFVDQFMSLDLQLPRQHVNADLVHRKKRFACFLSLP
jgi:hypothetical protein